MICSWIFSLLYNNSIFAKICGLFHLTEYSFQIQVWLIAYFLSHQIAYRCHGKGVACRCSVWYAACCDIAVPIIGQAKQNLVFRLLSWEIDIMVTNLIPPVEKSSPQI